MVMVAYIFNSCYQVVLKEFIINFHMMLPNMEVIRDFWLGIPLDIFVQLQYELADYVRPSFFKNKD